MNQPRSYTIEIVWGTSRAQDSYGYTTCSLRVDGKRRAYCNGGGYDMRGTVIGKFIAVEFTKELCKLKIPKNRRNGEDVREYYGLSFHDPNYDPGKAVVETDEPLMGGKAGETVEQREAAGKSIGLERYQAFHRASSNVPTKRHTVPLIDGACGLSSVETIIKALGYELRQVVNKSKLDVYELNPSRRK